MQYVRKFWIPAVLLIAFIAATVYATGNPDSMSSEERAEWISTHQKGHMYTLRGTAIDSVALADTLILEDGLEIQLWRFAVDGQFYNDILVWRQTGQDSYHMVHEFCIAQAALDESGEELSFSFQQGLYKYRGGVDGDFTLTPLVQSLSIVPILLCALLAIGYIVLIFYTLHYRKARRGKTAGGKAS